MHWRVDLCCFTQAGYTLVEEGHYDSASVQESMDGLFEDWEQLKEATMQRGRLLAEAQELVGFKREADVVILWMTEKVRLFFFFFTPMDLF